MKPENIKKALNDSIQAMASCSWLFSSRPGKDNTRIRKFPFQKMIPSILALGSGTLNREIMDFFGVDPSIGTSSAFIQRRATIIPEAFESLFQHFTDKVDEGKLYRSFRLLAVDGSDLRIAANPKDPDSYFPGEDGKKAFNLLHINAMYDLQQHIYMDALVQKRRKTDESGALTAMVDRSAIKEALLLADRGYESYNNLAHIQEKGWCFLIRIKNGAGGIVSGLSLPDANEFDVPFHLSLTRKHIPAPKQSLTDKKCYKRISEEKRFDFLPCGPKKKTQAQFFDLHFRIVRFPISDTACETIITNLDADLFPLPEIKKIYAMRWGIETSFRDLKHTLGLLHLHAKKVEFILQEIFAKLTMYNFCELITQTVVIQQGQRKHAYKVNFSDAVHVCKQFFLGVVPPPILEAVLVKYTSPIRPGRKDTRKTTQKPSVSFTYRVA